MNGNSSSVLHGTGGRSAGPRRNRVSSATYVVVLASLVSLIAAASAVGTACGQGANDSSPDGSSPQRPILQLKFDGPEEPGSTPATDKEDAWEPGPRPPLYPTFSPGNRARRFTARSTPLVVPDGGQRTDLRLAAGEAVTLEAWVRVADLPSGAYAYLVGKGRNGRKDYPEKNQNYALRLQGHAQGPRVSFLFASAAGEGRPGDWHRWTSREGLSPDRPWHHVAVTFTFGRADSVRGVIDGQEVVGDWDLGGATSLAPHVDDDDLHVGSGNGGGAGNRFVGGLDEVTVRRGAVPVEELKQRFTFVPQPPAVDRAALPAGQVRVEICEDGITSSTSWPGLPPVANEFFDIPAFGLIGIPHRYIDTGVRSDRSNPLLLRAAAVVTLPAGRHRWLLRARGLSRLYVDGELLLSLGPIKGDSGGHGHVPRSDEYLDLGPTFRFAPPGTQEAWKEVSIEGGERLVVCETLVGGALGSSRLRPELGETVVAISPAGSSQWQILTPGTTSHIYDDAAWETYATAQARHLEQLNTQARAACRARQAGVWEQRRAAAKAWLGSTPDVPVPPLPAGFPAHNAIDHFLASRIVEIAEQQRVARRGTVDYARDVQPILEAVCWDCHRGGKAQGGLQLDSLTRARRGGESGEPAIVPGDPAASRLLERVRAHDDSVRMPPRGPGLTSAQIDTLQRWIQEGAHWPELRVERLELTPLCDDLTFLRRVTLDTVGVLPSREELDAFLRDTHPEKRARVIERLLDDPRTADHGMGYWLDVFAENPNILNPTLNNTGPFRWWLYEALLDDKPLDMLATELIEMRGSERFGGPAGFAVATQNDVPLAAKATILSSAFLGIEMKCARCHDAPAHRSRQEDLFQLAAMLAGQPLEVPITSSVPLDKLGEGGRKPLIQVTLRPGMKVPPRWPFGELRASDIAPAVPAAGTATEPGTAGAGQDPGTGAGQSASGGPAESRARLAALVTAPHNERFAQVLANRLWQRVFGRGIVEPVEDWEKGSPTHPELLRWLGRELVRNGYQQKAILRLLLNSHAYQRAVDPQLRESSPLFVAPARRRLTAEQIVDSLFAATGAPFRLEEVSLDIDGRRDLKNSISLGIPRRAWMLTSTSNERDRPSLSLPRVQAVVDVLQAFGWRGARQDPASHRETAPNALQPAILANGVAGVWLTRLSDDHGLTQLALSDLTVVQLVDELYLRLLTRYPTDDERQRAVAHLTAGFAERRVAAPAGPPPAPHQPVRYVSWSNHLDPEATVIRQQQEQAARRGDPPTARLTPAWRERMEDIVWLLINSPEAVFTR